MTVGFRSRMTKGGKAAIGGLLLLAALSSLNAGENRRGASLKLETRDGRVIRAELLSVKGNDLVLMDTSLAGITVSIDAVKRLTIERRSAFFKGVGIGLVSGAAVGGSLGALSGDDPPGWFSWTAGQKALLGGLGFGLTGALIGGVSGALSGIDESVELPPGNDALRRQVLAKLAAISMAGNPSAIVAVNKMSPSAVKPDEAVIQQPGGAAQEAGAPPKAEFAEGKHNQTPETPKFTRFHLTVESAYSLSPIGGGLKQVMERWGFGDDISGSDYWFGPYSRDYPSSWGRRIALFRRVQVDYSITRLFSVGLAYRPLPKCDFEGYRHVKHYIDYGSYRTGIDLAGEFQGGAYYLLASLWPIPNGFTAKSTGKLSLGFGLADLRQTFSSESVAVMKKKPLSLTVAAEYDLFLSRNISIGLDIDYQYVPLRIDDFALTGSYYDTVWGTYDGPATARVLVELSFPGARVNVGGFQAGLNLGLHF